MDAIQILLVVVVVALTILLLVVGIQVILIVTDLRRAVKRLNTLLEDSIWGGGLLRPEKLTGIVEMIRRKKKLIESNKGNLQEKKTKSE